METKITENITDKQKSPYNIVVPFNIPGKPDIGIIDLNKIFQVNFNFDSLKILLEGLITAYKKTQEELENINAYNKVKSMKIEDLEQKILNLNISDNNILNNNEDNENSTNNNINIDKSSINNEVEKENKTIEKKQKKTIKSKSKSSKNLKKIHAPINKDLKLELQVGYDEITNKIIKKVNGFELSINDLVEAVPLMQKEQNINIEYINNLEDELNDVKLKLNDLFEENNMIKKKIRRK